MMVEVQQTETTAVGARPDGSLVGATRWANLILFALGWLLLAAALLKVHGSAVEPIRESGWFLYPSIRIAIVLLEIGLGIWFLSGKQTALAWLMALVLFITFAVVSFNQGWIGEASCGCFGQIIVSPWLAFAIDIAVLVPPQD